MGGPSSHWRSRRHTAGDELGEGGHQVGVEAAVARDGSVDECVAVHLEPGRFRRPARQERVVLEQFGEERLVDAAGPGDLPVAIAGQRAAGEPARQPVQRRVRRAGVEPEDLRRIVVEHGEIRDPAEVQDRPAAMGLATPSPAEEHRVGDRRERRTLAAGRDVAGTEVRDDVPARPDRDHVAVADLERRPERTGDAAVMIDRLAVRADEVDVCPARAPPPRSSPGRPRRRPRRS